MTKRQPHARGFTITEAVFAAGVIAMVAGTLAVALQKHETLAGISAERRDASWRVEGLLTQLQHGELDPAMRDDAALTFEKLDDPAVQRHVWVGIIETTEHGEVSIFGLVPQDAWDDFEDQP